MNNNNLDIETITLDQLSSVTGGWAWNQSSPSHDSWSGSIAGAGATGAAWAGANNAQQWSWSK